MKESLVSVIVPIYQVEPYLRRCVDSILRQSYSNLEIILVDDGSSDGCPAVCDEYAARDGRIKVIHKRNGGLSDARNAALEVLRGEYVTFVDGDDYVSDDYVETLSRLLTENDADISCVQFLRFSGGREPARPSGGESFEILNSHEALRKLMYFDGLETSANCKLYRASLFHGVRYPVGKLFEDLGTTYRLLLKAKKTVNSRAEKYYYLQRADSIEKSSFSPRKMDLLEMCGELRRGALALFPDLSRAWNCRFFCANFHVFLQIPEGRFEDQAGILRKNIKNYRRGVLFDRHARKKARAAALLSYLGLDFARRLRSFNQFKIGLKSC